MWFCLSLTISSTHSRWLGQSVPWMIEKHGGLEDFVVDPFGFKYQVRRNFAPGGHVDEDGGKHNICILGFMIFLSASYGSNNIFSLARPKPP